MPTKLVDTTYLETASDDWFADLDGDGLAEMAVGRLPVRTVEEAQSMVSKIVDPFRGPDYQVEILKWVSPTEHLS